MEETASFRTRLNQLAKSLAEATKNYPIILYQIILTLFIFTFYLRRINWIPSWTAPILRVWTVIFSSVLWSAALSLFYIIASGLNLWKKPIWLILLGVALGGLTVLGANKLSVNAYSIVMDIILCLLAYGKNYRRILHCYLIVSAGTLIMGALLMLVGLAPDKGKPDNPSPGHGFGIIYPNDWGYMAFLALIVIWYLWLRRKAVITFVLFWGMTVFLYFVISCRTISLLTAAFPVLALVAELLEKRAGKSGKRRTGLAILFGAIPFLAFLASLLLAWKMEWVHKMFYYTPLHTMAMRFVQGGLAIRHFGFPFIGHIMYLDTEVAAMLNGHKEVLYVMDNAYLSYVIMRGVLWMAGCLSWLAIANVKAWKRRDIRLLYLSAILAVFAMMEWAGLNAWFNFILLYPLALVAGAKEEPAPALETPEPEAPELAAPADPAPDDAAGAEPTADPE